MCGNSGPRHRRVGCRFHFFANHPRPFSHPCLLLLSSFLLLATTLKGASGWHFTGHSLTCAVLTGNVMASTTLPLPPPGSISRPDAAASPGSLATPVGLAPAAPHASYAADAEKTCAQRAPSGSRNSRRSQFSAIKRSFLPWVGSAAWRVQRPPRRPGNLL